MEVESSSWQAWRQWNCGMRSLMLRFEKQASYH